MRKRILVGSIIAIAIIVLASFSSVVGKVASDDELVEFDVELCRLGKKHTVQLTQQEADEVELLFDDMQDRLSAAKSDDEAMVIFNEAVVELDKYGLLGGLSVKQAQRLITFQYQNLRGNKFLQKIVNAEKLDDNENSFCLISGKITYADFFRLPFLLFYMICGMISGGFLEFWYPIISILNEKNPLKLFSSISISYYTWYIAGPDEPFPSKGSIWTNGANGIKEWDGTLKGDIDEIRLSGKGGFSGHVYNLGVKGFVGIQITIGGLTQFFGFARNVKIKYY